MSATIRCGEEATVRRSAEDPPPQPDKAARRIRKYDMACILEVIRRKEAGCQRLISKLQSASIAFWVRARMATISEARTRTPKAAVSKRTAAAAPEATAARGDVIHRRQAKRASGAPKRIRTRRSMPS